MITQESFNEMVDEIMTKGFDEKTAAHFASLIGDTPEMDEEDNVVVRENGKTLAKFKLTRFDMRKVRPERFTWNQSDVTIYPPDSPLARALTLRRERGLKSQGMTHEQLIEWLKTQEPKG